MLRVSSISSTNQRDGDVDWAPLLMIVFSEHTEVLADVRQRHVLVVHLDPRRRHELLVFALAFGAALDVDAAYRASDVFWELRKRDQIAVGVVQLARIEVTNRGHVFCPALGR